MQGEKEAKDVHYEVGKKAWLRFLLVQWIIPYKIKVSLKWHLTTFHIKWYIFDKKMMISTEIVLFSWHIFNVDNDSGIPYKIRLNLISLKYDN